MRIGFLGFGELGKQIELMVNLYYPTCPKVYFDDYAVTYSSLECLCFEDYKRHLKDFYWLVCIGYKHMETRVALIKEIRELGRLLSLVHPTSYVSPSANLSDGVIVKPMCNIDKEVYLGNGVLLNNSVTISHNCEIGEGVYISPGVILSGNVKVGEGTFIGSGTVIANNVTIGSNVHVGIGTVISKDIPDNAWVIGNPQKFLTKPFKLN